MPITGRPRKFKVPCDVSFVMEKSVMDELDAFCAQFSLVKSDVIRAMINAGLAAIRDDPKKALMNILELEPAGVADEQE